jgi:hypothetical protein
MNTSTAGRHGLTLLAEAEIAAVAGGIIWVPGGPPFGPPAPPPGPHHPQNDEPPVPPGGYRP